jgi:prophage antirepressor-like protein
MDNELEVFSNEEFGTIRTVVENDKVLFVANDVARALGYNSPKDAVTRHCKGAMKHRYLTEGGEQELKVIPEGDIYRLIVKSQLQTAEKFELWVFDEVLPTIRKTGGYVNNDDLFVTTYLPFADTQTVLMFKTTLETVRKQNELIKK